MIFDGFLLWLCMLRQSAYFVLGDILESLSFDKQVPINNDEFPIVILSQQSLDCDRFVHNFYVSSYLQKKLTSKMESQSLWMDTTSHNNKLVNNNFMFASPLFPGNYTRNLNCVKVIEAPKPDHVIQINFRKNFDLENSHNCINDYIEIRDGKYGFSKKIVRLCGEKGEQSSITSSGPYLWLNFRSDSQIERCGFQAIFHFSRNLKQPDTRYYEFSEKFILDKSEMIINEGSIQKMWKSRHPTIERAEYPVEFYIEIHSLDKFYFLVTLQYAKFQIQDPDCTVNFIELYSGLTLESLHADEEIQKKPLNRACNEPTLAPKVINAGDFAVIRIVLGPYKYRTDYGSYWSDDMVDFTVITTKLFSQPCEVDQMVCMKPNNETDPNPITTEDLSVVEDHHVDKPESYVLQNEIENEGFLIHGPHPVFCIEKMLFCNKHWNCPDKEDEDSFCDRQDYQNSTEKDSHTHYSGTSTAATTVMTKAVKESVDYLHHYIIIASLFAFCGICGLSSGAMTWLHRKRIDAFKKSVTQAKVELPPTEYEFNTRENSNKVTEEYSINDKEKYGNPRNPNLDRNFNDRCDEKKMKMVQLMPNSIADNSSNDNNNMDEKEKSICEIFWQDNSAAENLDKFMEHGISITSDSTYPIESFVDDNLCNCHLKDQLPVVSQKDSSWIEDSTDVENYNFEFEKSNDPLVQFSSFQVLNHTSV